MKRSLVTMEMTLCKHNTKIGTIQIKAADQTKFKVGRSLVTMVNIKGTVQIKANSMAS